MGTQQRYKVPMFDTTYRVVREVKGDKDKTLFGGDDFAEAEAEYARLVKTTEGVIQLLHRSRIVRRSDEH